MSLGDGVAGLLEAGERVEQCAHLTLQQVQVAVQVLVQLGELAQQVAPSRPTNIKLGDNIENFCLILDSVHNVQPFAELISFRKSSLLFFFRTPVQDRFLEPITIGTVR